MTPAARERAQVRVPVLAVSAAAWAMLIAAPREGAVAMHAVHAAPRLPSATGWFLMIAAMMAPLLSAPIGYIRNRTLARQRARVIALFVASYALIWMVAEAVLQVIATRVHALESPLPGAVAACVVALWQCSPLKQRCLNRGHVHPELAPGGRAADIGAVRFGVNHAAWCVGSCWALMLLPLVARLEGRSEAGPAVHLAAMAVVALWCAGERLERPKPVQWSVRGPSKALRAALNRVFALRDHAIRNCANHAGKDIRAVSRGT